MGVYWCGVYALRIREVIPFSWEKEDHICLTWMLAWESNLWATVTARSTHVEFVVTVMIIGVGG